MLSIDTLSEEVIAGSLKGAHVTMRWMSRAAVALFLALFMGACAAAETPGEPSAETTEALASLEDRIAQLEADLEEELESGGADRAKLEGKLDDLAGKLERSLDRLRDALDGLRGGSAEIREAADSALATARSVASDLSVLEERYEYHLRRYHGGGG